MYKGISQECVCTYIYIPCIFPTVELTVIWYWIVASIWLGDLYREASLNTEGTVEKKHKMPCFFFHYILSLSDLVCSV